MSISKKDNLQNLIKSLSKTEKKFFRESLKNSTSEKLYLQLFNLIDTKANPTQQDLKKLFDNKANQLGVIKKYLSNLILRTLKILHHDTTIDQQIFNSFLNFQIFLKKDLYDLAESEIEKNIKICRQAEKLIPLLQSLDLKKQFLIQKFGATNEATKKTFNEILEEQNELFKKLDNLHKYQHLQNNFYDQFYQSSGYSRTVYTSLHTNPLLTSDNAPESTPAKILQAELLFSMHVYKDQNYQEALAASHKIIKNLELNPHYIKENPEVYLNLLNQQLQLFLHLRKFKEIPALLEKIRQSPETFHFDIQKPNLLRTTLETFQLEMQLYTETQDFSNGEKLIPQITAVYKKLNSPALKQWETLLNYEIARLFYAQKKLPETLIVIEKLQKSPHSQREADTLLRALYLAAIINIQQEDYLHLKKTLLNIKKTHTNAPKPPQVAEKQLIKLLENYPTLILKPARYKHILKQLNTIKNTLEKRENGMLSELVNWLEETFLLKSNASTTP